MPAKTTSRHVALLVPIIQLILGRAETLPVSVSLVPMFQVGIGLKEWSKLSDVLHVVESKHALDQVRAGCGAENGRHQFARLRDHLVASHRILGRATNMLDPLAEARPVVQRNFDDSHSHRYQLQRAGRADRKSTRLNSSHT